MRLEPGAVRHVNRPRRDVVHRGGIVITERAKIGPSAEQPVARRQRGQREAQRHQIGQFLEHGPVIRRGSRRRIDLQRKIGLGGPRPRKRNRRLGGWRCRRARLRVWRQIGQLAFDVSEFGVEIRARGADDGTRRISDRGSVAHRARSKPVIERGDADALRGLLVWQPGGDIEIGNPGGQSRRHDECSNGEGRLAWP